MTTLHAQLLAMLELDDLLDQWAISNPERSTMSDLPRIDSIEVARQQPNTMVNDDGEVFYPDSDEDATWFAEQHGARYLDTLACCDSHNRHCEAPADLCCRQCTEAAHDTFPIRHADGSGCIMEDQK